MNEEVNRLNSFDNWPADAVVTPARIAKAGFYYTNEGLTVQCFACHIRISEWEYGDQVMTRHRNLNPLCPFVLNPTTSGNVPAISQFATVTAPNLPAWPIAVNPNYQDETVRLQTFENWPISHIVTPESLARAGFYYLRHDDSTKCAYCKGIVRAWEIGDDPDLEHKRHFPRCQFVIQNIVPRLNNTNEPVFTTVVPTKSESSSNISEVNKDDSNKLVHKAPKFPDFGTLESRLRTFTTWPRDLIQTPDVLAQAGFYFEGQGDLVRCFHCDGGLRHWDPQDDPWTEHARWFPQCAFVNIVKGRNFVNACSLHDNVGSNLELVAQKSTANAPSARRHEITERELQEQLSSPSAIAALSIGLNVERVKRAIREKIEQTGRGYSQADALVEAALNIQHDEDSTSTTHDNFDNQISSAVRHVLTAAIDNAFDKNIPQNKNEEPHQTDPTSKSNNSDINSQPDSDKSNENSISLEEENRQLKEARLCKICMDSEVGIVFLPCGHLATCVNCAPNLEYCPVCRSTIKEIVRTFLS